MFVRGKPLTGWLLVVYQIWICWNFWAVRFREFLSLSLLGVLLVEYESLLSIDSVWFQLLYNLAGINQLVLYTKSVLFLSKKMELS